MVKGIIARLVVIVVVMVHSGLLIAAESLCVLSLVKKVRSVQLDFEIGAEVELQFLKSSMGVGPGKIRAIYLGRLVEIDNTPSEHAFYDEDKQVIHFVNEKEILIEKNVDVNGQMRKVAKSLSQSMGTCAAFALYNCMHQMYLSGIQGNGILETVFKTEQGRVSVIERAIMSYYGDETHVDGIEQVTEHYGLKQEEINNFSLDSFKKEVVRSAKESGVLLLRFDVPMRMSQADYELYDHVEKKHLRTDIWQPMGPNDQRQGGHMILVSNVFQTKSGKIYLVVQDSNWKTIRLWDLDILNNLRSAQIRAWRIYE